MDVDERVLWREVALFVVVALVQIGGTIAAAANQDEHAAPPIGGIALLALAVVAVPFRLRYPVPALFAATGATVAYVASDYAPGPLWLALIITFGNAVLAGHRRIALGVMVVGFFGTNWLGPLFDRGEAPSVAVAFALAAWLLVLYTACELIRTRRDRAREAARAKEDLLQRQVANERLAIARELHDVVAHNMSLINLQAGVALHVNDDLPEDARQALQTIKTASKEALVELRSILGVLRHADDGDNAPRSPTPGLAGVGDLVTRAQAAGVDVNVRLGVTPAELPRPVDMAAFRIVQESLTNVARHADPPVATIDVHQRNGCLVVSIVDAGTGLGRAEALPSGGNGIPGMRERAAAVGGTLAAGPQLRGGFAVEAHLPLDDPS